MRRWTSIALAAACLMLVLGVVLAVVAVNTPTSGEVRPNPVRPVTVDPTP